MSKWVKISWCYLKNILWHAMTCTIFISKCAQHKPHLPVEMISSRGNNSVMLQPERFWKEVFAQSTWKFTVW